MARALKAGIKAHGGISFRTNPKSLRPYSSKQGWLMDPGLDNAGVDGCCRPVLCRCEFIRTLGLRLVRAVKQVLRAPRSFLSG
jgi:hypothetical protein